MTDSKNTTLPLALGLIAIVFVVLLATLVVPLLVGLAKVLLVVALVLLVAVASGFMGYALRVSGALTRK